MVRYRQRIRKRELEVGINFRRTHERLVADRKGLAGIELRVFVRGLCAYLSPFQSI